MIISFRLIIVAGKLSKRTEEMSQPAKMQLKMRKKLQNTQKSDNFHNVNAVNYNLDPVDPIAKGIEGHDVMDYNLKPIDPVILLFHVFGYDIVNNRFEKEMKMLIVRDDFLRELLLLLMDLIEMYNHQCYYW